MTGGSLFNNWTITGSEGDGGGIYTEGGPVTFTGTNIYSNTADSNGGGFYCSGGSLNLVNSTLSGNFAVGIGDGGAYKAPGTFSKSGGTITDAVVDVT
jgi:hypothetical protein